LRSRKPAIKRVSGEKAINLSEISKLPNDSCKNPVRVGPNEDPTAAIVITVADETAISLGRIFFMWNGTMNNNGKKPQAMPFMIAIPINK